MFTGIAYSTVLATVAVVAVLAVGWYWIAPKLRVTRRSFFVFTLWGIPFVIGQYSQQCEWGPQWMQRHLLDLAYAPWGTALVTSLSIIGVAALGREIAEKALTVGSLLVILAFGYVSELWDTAWAWHATGSLVSAIDIGDYFAITTGGVITIVLYLRLR